MKREGQRDAGERKKRRVQPETNFQNETARNFDLFWKENKHLLRNVPSHPPDQEAFDEWIEALEDTGVEEAIAFGKLLRLRLRHVSFAEFDNRANAVAYGLRLDAERTRYERVYLVVPDTIRKSNTWVSLLMWHHLRRIVTHVVDRADVVAAHVRDLGPSARILAIHPDDGTYSGQQLHNRTSKILNGLKDYADLYGVQPPYYALSYTFAIPFMSREGERFLDSIPYVAFSTETTRMPPSLLAPRPAGNQVALSKPLRELFGAEWSDKPFYFDHKLADFVSTFNKTLALAPVPADPTVPDSEPRSLGRSLIRGCAPEEYRLKSTGERATVTDVVEDFAVDGVCPRAYYKHLQYTWKGQPADDTDIVSLLGSPAEIEESSNNAHSPLRYMETSLLWMKPLFEALWKNSPNIFNIGNHPLDKAAVALWRSNWEVWRDAAYARATRAGPEMVAELPTAVIEWPAQYAAALEQHLRFISFWELHAAMRRLLEIERQVGRTRGALTYVLLLGSTGIWPTTFSWPTLREFVHGVSLFGSPYGILSEVLRVGPNRPVTILVVDDYVTDLQPILRIVTRRRWNDPEGPFRSAEFVITAPYADEALRDALGSAPRARWAAGTTFLPARLPLPPYPRSASPNLLEKRITNTDEDTATTYRDVFGNNVAPDEQFSIKDGAVYFAHRIPPAVNTHVLLLSPRPALPSGTFSFTDLPLRAGPSLLQGFSAEDALRFTSGPFDFQTAERTSAFLNRRAQERRLPRESSVYADLSPRLFKAQSQQVMARLTMREYRVANPDKPAVYFSFGDELMSTSADWSTEDRQGFTDGSVHLITHLLEKMEPRMLVKYLPRPDIPDVRTSTDISSLVRGMRACTVDACASCRRTVDLRACGRCRAVRYCSQTCQRLHWSVHSQRCRDQ